MSQVCHLSSWQARQARRHKAVLPLFPGASDEVSGCRVSAPVSPGVLLLGVAHRADC